MLGMVMGCTPEPPLDPDDSGGGSNVLTTANHSSGYGSLGCFQSGCHRSSGTGYRPDGDEHYLVGLSCVDSGCHGINGVAWLTLVTGRVYSDRTGISPEADVTVIARDVSNPDAVYLSEPSDEDGQFSLLIPEIGTFHWTLRDRTRDEIRSEDFGMEPLTLGASYVRSMDCSGCHDDVSASFLTVAR